MRRGGNLGPVNSSAGRYVRRRHRRETSRNVTKRYGTFSRIFRSPTPPHRSPGHCSARPNAIVRQRNKFRASSPRHYGGKPRRLYGNDLRNNFFRSPLPLGSQKKNARSAAEKRIFSRFLVFPYPSCVSRGRHYRALRTARDFTDYYFYFFIIYSDSSFSFSPGACAFVRYDV